MKLRNRLGFALCVSLLAASHSASAAEPKPVLGKIVAKLYFNEQGDWSPDLLAKSTSWTGWNTIIGEGDSGGASQDLMVEVGLSAPGAEDAVTTEIPVTITAMAGKKLLGRRVSKFTLIPHQGSSRLALFLTDATCAGRIDITATFGKQVKKARLNMDCGE